MYLGIGKMYIGQWLNCTNLGYSDSALLHCQKFVPEKECDFFLNSIFKLPKSNLLNIAMFRLGPMSYWLYIDLNRSRLDECMSSPIYLYARIMHTDRLGITFNQN